MSEVTYDFTGKNFVVVGASSGMGRQVVTELSIAGAKVLAIARRKQNLEELQKQCVNVEYAACDINHIDLVEQSLVNFVEKNGKIHGTVYTAGIAEFTPFKWFDCKTAKEILEISFWGAVSFLQLSMKNKYIEEGSSHVVFSSVSGHSGEKGTFAYSGAKAAIRVAVKSIAKEIAHKKHRINSISPGWIRNEMTQKMGGLANPKAFSNDHLLDTGKNTDISGVVLFLLSDRAKWITGTDIIVDGGYLA